MQNIRQYASLVLILLIVGFVTPQCTNCPAGFQCCNDLNGNNGLPTCYNPNVHQCNGGNRLCPKGFNSCGRDCYSPAVHQCNPDGKLCPAGFKSCGPACYSPNQYACNNNQIYTRCLQGACPGYKCCPSDGMCYNPNHYDCTESGLKWKCFPTALGICSGRGTCVALDICACNPGYYGRGCEYGSGP